MGYGSGDPADYRNYSRFLSSPDVWQSANVWLFGDSLAYAGRDALRTRVNAAGGEIAFDAWSARPTTPAVDELVARLSDPALSKPEVVILMSVNDIFNPPALAAQIERAQFFCDTYGIRLLWMDAFARRAGFEQADLINCAWLNEQIHAAIRPANIIRWHRLFAQDKNRINNRLRDGLHPKPDQQDFWAASVMSVLGPLI